MQATEISSQINEGRFIPLNIYIAISGLPNINWSINLLCLSCVVYWENCQTGIFTRLHERKPSSTQTISQLPRATGIQYDWRENEGHFALLKCDSRYFVTGKVVTSLFIEI